MTTLATWASSHKAPLICFLLALISGGLFIAFAPHPELAGDARDYLDASKSLFTNFYTGTASSPHIHFGRSPVYMTFLAVCNLLFGSMGEPAVILAARSVQVVLYAAIIGFLYQITLLVFSDRKAAIIAGTLGLIYTPFVFYTDRLLAEIPMISVLLMAVYGWYLKKPVLCILMILILLQIKFFMMWPVILLLLVSRLIMEVSDTRSHRQKVSREFINSAGLLVAFVVLVFLQYQIFNTRLQSAGTLIWNYADNEGWAPLVQIASELGFQSVQRNPMQWLMLYPDKFFTLLFSNIVHFFQMPENTYLQSWLGIGQHTLNFIHRALVVLFFVSCPFIFKFPRLGLFYLITALVGLVCALYHIEPRYNLLVMPFVIIASAGVTGLFLERFKQVKKKDMGIAILGFCLIYVWFNGVVYPHLLEVIPGLTPIFYRLAGILLALSWLVFLFWKLVSALEPWKRYPKLPSRTFLVFIGTTVLLLPVFTERVLMPHIEEWSAPLSANSRLHKRITLDQESFVFGHFKTFLLIETAPFFISADVMVNGLPVTAIYEAQPGLSQLKYMTGGFFQLEDFRQYAWIPLPEQVVRSMSESREAHIIIAPKPNTPAFRLYGDYPLTHADEGKSQYAIPNPDWSLYSSYKTAFDRDGRTPVVVTSASQSWVEQDGKKIVSEHDLSNSPGKQTGQFRILIFQLLPQDAVQAEFPRPLFYQAPDGSLTRAFTLNY